MPASIMTCAKSNSTSKMIESLSKALFDTDLVATRLMLFVAEALWAVMLFWPGATFEREVYAVMREVTTESAWAFVFSVTATFQLTIIVTQDYDSRFARYFAAWNATLWVFSVSSMLVSVYPPPAAIGGEMALACAAVWIWLRPAILAEGLRRARYCKRH